MLDRVLDGQVVTANPTFRCPACNRFLMEALPSFAGAVRVPHHCGAHIVIVRDGERFILFWDQGEGALRRLRERFREWADCQLTNA